MALRLRGDVAQRPDELDTALDGRLPHLVGRPDRRRVDPDGATNQGRHAEGLRGGDAAEPGGGGAGGWSPQTAGDDTRGTQVLPAALEGRLADGVRRPDPGRPQRDPAADHLGEAEGGRRHQAPGSDAEGRKAGRAHLGAWARARRFARRPSGAMVARRLMRALMSVGWTMRPRLVNRAPSSNCPTVARASSRTLAGATPPCSFTHSGSSSPYGL